MLYTEEEINKYTPMMRQYLQIKKDYRDAIVFFRLGDFYEMFFDDAETASRELEIALTGRDVGQKTKAPMCGIPFHAYEGYATKLIEKGYRVVIVEQLTNPVAGPSIVERGVIKILTPGTLVDSGLKDNENNYVVALNKIGRNYVLVSADVSTGESNLNIYDNLDTALNEIVSLHSKEAVVGNSYAPKKLFDLTNNYQIMISKEEVCELPEYLTYVVEDIPEEYISTVGLLLNYLINTQKRDLNHLKKTTLFLTKDYMRLDPFSKKNLELSETLRGGQRKGSLLGHLDKCSTAMGSRMLSRWINRPLMDENKINLRLDFIESLNKNFIIKENIKDSLKTVYDLERILGRISVGNANAKDLVQLRRSLSNVPIIKENIKKLEFTEAKDFSNTIDEQHELFLLLTRSLVDNPPLTIKEGGMFLDGYNTDLAELRSISNNSKDWIINFEKSEKERLEIAKLKVGFNRIFGYYIEVPKKEIDKVPKDGTYTRKQTVANAERYVTKELKHYESIVSNSKEKIVDIEYALFLELRTLSASYTKSLQILADKLSFIDCMVSLSEVSVLHNYVRPTFNHNNEVTIISGRHPVLETILEDNFVKNDIIINKYNMIIITGPNMSGKSTYMKQFALINIMAQIGCFVPALSCNTMIYDAIYTRIGASDDLISGQSTFMVEMLEARYALKNATKNSLILFDELGRGTATFDGMALAQAIIEYIHESIKCTTLFSTHYHELVMLEHHLKKLKNVHVEAIEEKQGIVFLHQVCDGASDKSYGINVASLAKMPRSILKRSSDILDGLEENANIKENITVDLFNFDAYDETPENVKKDFASTVVDEIREVNIDNLTPIDALNILAKLKKDVS